MELLVFILEKATGMSLSRYAALKLWQPLGAETPASGVPTIREDGRRLIAALTPMPAILPRIGQLMLDSGKWKGVP